MPRPSQNLMQAIGGNPAAQKELGLYLDALMPALKGGNSITNIIGGGGSGGLISQIVAGNGLGGGGTAGIVTLDVNGGLGIDLIGDQVSVAVAPMSGLSFIGGGLAVGAGDGIALVGGNVTIAPGAGIALSGGLLVADLATLKGLYISGGGIAVSVGDGIEFVGGAVSVAAGDGIYLPAGAVTVNVDSGKGLQFNSGKLAVAVGAGIALPGGAVAVDQAYNFTWTGWHAFEQTIVSHSITPEATDTYDLGTSLKLWRKGWLSELDAILFAENTITLLGGWLMVSKDEGKLPSDSGVSPTNPIDFGKEMTPGDFVLFRSSLLMEYMEVGTRVGGPGTTVYNVTRDLDGSGANNWVAGSVFAVLGQSGDGRIELNAYDTPRISIVTQGAAYDAQTELIRLGDLNGWGHFKAPTYGIAIGDYAAGNYLSYEPGEDLRIVAGGGVVAIDDNGISISTSGGANAFSFFEDTSFSKRIGTIQADILVTTGEIGMIGRGIDAGHPHGKAYISSGSHSGNAEAQLILFSNGTTGASSLLLYPGYGLSLAGFVIGSSVAPANAMLDVRGDGIITGGLNLGTATGAAAGAIRASNDIYARNLYPGSQSTRYIGDAAGGMTINGGSCAVMGGPLYGMYGIYSRSGYYTGASDTQGYLYVPLVAALDLTDTTSVLFANRTAGVATYYFRLADAPNGLPSGIKAVSLWITGQWALPNNNSVLSVRPHGSANAQIMARSLVANINNDMSGICATDGASNAGIDMVVGNATVNVCYVRVTGYFI